jgi:hypothetical protein
VNNAGHFTVYKERVTEQAFRKTIDGTARHYIAGKLSSNFVY